MKDAATKKALRVSTDGNAGPYLMVTVDQLEELRHLLDDRGISYWVDEDAISLNGEPETSAVNFGRGGNAEAVQRILDEVG